MKRILLLLFLLIISSSHVIIGQVYSTIQSIGGVINSYTPVTAVQPCSLAVVSSSGLAIGNRVLIIQMKGADISLVNDNSFGDISSINSAGNYEFALITSIAGTTIGLDKNLTRTYDPTNGVVQLVTVPQYNGGATVVSTLTAQNWNGTTGGVLVFEASTLTLSANIDVTGRGFRSGIQHGGASSSGDPSFRSPNNGVYNTNTSTIFFNSCGRVIWSDDPVKWATLCSGAWRNAGNTGCGCTILAPECLNPYVTDPLFYASGQNFTCNGRLLSTTTEVNAEKGEGVHVTQAWYSRGRGKISNGGGGGNMHNGGGGGGSNFGVGGIGGRGLSGTTGPELAQGMGGSSLSAYYPIKLFLGGGGGAGQGNDNRAIEGSNGGGIFIIRALTLQNPSGFRILANGEDNFRVSPNTGGYDGAGGGGGGGAGILSINTYANTISIEAKGGKGADNLFGAINDCYAPGGGGGGGVIVFSQPATPAGVTTIVTGGIAGVQSTPSTCTGTFTASYGAQPGGLGGVLYNATLPEGTVNCALPVVMISFKAITSENIVRLDWITASEKNNDHFEILRTVDGIHWEVIGLISGKGTSNQSNYYYFNDKYPPTGKIYYKIRDVDFEGSFYDSAVEVVYIENEYTDKFEIYPNPSDRSSELTLVCNATEGEELIIEISDVLGKVIFSKSFGTVNGINKLNIQAGILSSGCYLVSLKGHYYRSTKIINVY